MIDLNEYPNWNWGTIIVVKLILKCEFQKENLELLQYVPNYLKDYYSLFSAIEGGN